VKRSVLLAVLTLVAVAAGPAPAQAAEPTAHGFAIGEKSAVAFPPPHLSIPRAEHQAKESLEFFCDESGLCESQSTGPCTRKNAAAVGCRYTATLTSGDVCTGTFRIKALGEGAILNTPGVISTEEGECFYLFEPPELRELEEEEKEREKKG
jgi:hypothetical protein